jgi:L-malate glycosyltransferase
MAEPGIDRVEIVSASDDNFALPLGVKQMPLSLSQILFVSKPPDNNKVWMNVKVLVLTSSFPRHEGSHEARWVLELVQWLNHYGFIPLVLAPHFPGGKIQESWNHQVEIYRFVYFLPIRFERLAYGPGLLFNVKSDFFAYLGVVPFLISGFLSALILVLDEQVAIIHTHWLIPQGFVGAVFHRIWNIPHIATIHGSDFNFIARHKPLAPVCKFIIRHSDSITVNSTYMKQQLEIFAPESGEKIRVIPMGIDPGKYSQGTFSGLKKKYPARHIILSVGRLIDWKGTIYLIDAMPDVLRQFPDTMLIIIGAGPEKKMLVDRTNELGLENRIHFPGIVDTEDLPFYYHGADIFVLPSINKSGNTEAFGVVLLEAMASGCPVIGSDVGGIPDIIIDGETGFLVPEQRADILAEKIVRLLLDDRLREQFRQNGLIRIRENFLWDKIAKDFRDLFDQVLKGTSG